MTASTVTLRRAAGTLSPWARGFIIAVIVSKLLFLANVLLGEVDASSTWGLVYGSVATALMVGVALLGVRRRTMRWGIGRARTWQQFHIYGGGLFFLWVLMHAGFTLPKGAMTWWLMALSFWVFLSGVIGVLVHTWVPRTLTSGLRVEAVYERIPTLVEDLRARAEKLAGESPAVVADFYRRSVEPLMRGPMPRMAYVFDVTAGSRAIRDSFRFLRGMVPGNEQKRVDDLEELAATKLELDAHYTLQKALRLWMALHLPPSIALLVLVGLHIFAVVYW